MALLTDDAKILNRAYEIYTYVEMYDQLDRDESLLRNDEAGEVAARYARDVHTSITTKKKEVLRCLRKALGEH